MILSLLLGANNILNFDNLKALSKHLVFGFFLEYPCSEEKHDVGTTLFFIFVIQSKACMFVLYDLCTTSDTVLDLCVHIINRFTLTHV